MGGLKLSNLIEINTPCDKKLISGLKTGDIVSINGTIATGRDAFHKLVNEKYIKNNTRDKTFEQISKILKNSFLYHCGPVIKTEENNYTFVAGGPTTSIREEPYESDVIKLFGLNGVIGKGGMGEKTLNGLQENTAVYLHATGGAAALIGNRVKLIKDVFFKELGTPEAMWVIEVKNFRCTVTMDSHGNSLHNEIYKTSKEKLNMFK